MQTQSKRSYFSQRFFETYRYIIALLVIMLAGLVFYANSPILPWKFLLLIFGISTIVIVCLPKKLEYATVLIILVFGAMSAVISPINDIPDETVHFARSSFLSTGQLNLSNDVDELLVSEDILHLETVNKQSLVNNTNDKRHSSKMISYPHVLMTNAYYNISYVPQALGLLVGKTVGLEVLDMYLLGRLFNVLTYALLIFVAIRLAGRLGQIVAVIALLPMNIYLSGSFNQDVVANGLLFVVLSLFFSFLQKDKISLLSYGLYTVLCGLVAFVKLPYILFIGLPFFLPNAKYRLSWSKVMGLKCLSVLAVLGVGLVWFKLYGQITSPVYETVAFLKEVNVGKQLAAILASPLVYGLAMLRALSNYLLELDSTNTFGPLSYGMSNLSSLLMMFYYSLILNNANQVKMSRWTKLGVILVSLGISCGIALALLLTWTPAGSYHILGLQGRYFIGLYPLIIATLAANNRLFERCQGMLSQRLLLTTGIYFIVLMLLTTLFNYYIS